MRSNISNFLDALTQLEQGGPLENKLLVFKEWLKQTPSLAQRITAEMLSKSHIEYEVSIFFCLTLSEIGRDILEALLGENLALAKHITADMLGALNKNDNTSALFWLAGSDQGCYILGALLEKNPALIQQITADMLVKSSVYHDNTAVFFLLASAPSGHAILRALLERNPALAECITADMLGALHQNKISALLLLVGSDEEENRDGCAILKILLEKNPALAKHITADMLGGAYDGISVLFYLADSEDGRAVLHVLLEKNPALAKGITREMLTDQVDAANEYSAQYNSVLFSLASTERGCAIVHALLEKNPDLAKGIELSMLEPLEGSVDSVLFLLAKCDSGCSILKKIFEANPNLVSHINPASFSLHSDIEDHPVNRVFDPTIYSFARLHVLTGTRNGLAVFKMLLEQNPVFLAALTGEALVRTSSRSIIFSEVSALYLLSRSDEGLHCLAFILQRNPALLYHEGFTTHFFNFRPTPRPDDKKVFSFVDEDEREETFATTWVPRLWHEYNASENFFKEISTVYEKMQQANLLSKEVLSIMGDIQAGIPSPVRK